MIKVLFKGRVIFLPDCLFYARQRQTGNTSPDAVFDVDGALSGSPWQSSLSPSATPIKKTLIIDSATFPYPFPDDVCDAFVFIDCLKNHLDFNVYIKSNYSPLCTHSVSILEY